MSDRQYVSKKEFSIMDSKYDKSDLSAGERDFSFSIESCNHLISNSLRDLSIKYKDLNRGQISLSDLNKKDLTDSAQRKKADKD